MMAMAIIKAREMPITRTITKAITIKTNIPNMRGTMIEAVTTMRILAILTATMEATMKGIMAIRMTIIMISTMTKAMVIHKAEAAVGVILKTTRSHSVTSP